MVFDLDMIKAVYSGMNDRIEAARKVVKQPLTLAEKILYSHLHSGQSLEVFARGQILCRFCSRSSSHARCNCSNGFTTIYASWQEKSRRPKYSTLRSFDPGKRRSCSGSEKLHQHQQRGI